MISLHFHLHPQYKYELFHVNFTFVDLVAVMSRGRKGQSYPVEYYLESVGEKYKGKIHKSEPKQWNRNVKTVYFANQARGNTRTMNERLQCLLIFELPAWNNARKKYINILLQITFYA